MTAKTSRLTSGSAGERGPAHWIPLVILGVVMVVGFVMANDYGISTDEPENYEVGVDALRAMVSWRGYQDYFAHGEPLAHHGPSYFMLFAGLAGLFQHIPGWNLADARHWVNFITFVAGCIAFYGLSRRFFRRGVALVATLFFGLQPLLLGHAFINQKDTPFLAFFTIGVTLGLYAVDEMVANLRLNRSSPEKARGWKGVRSRWQAISSWRRVAAALTLSALLLVLLDLTTAGLLLGFAKSLIAQAYRGSAWPPLQAAFSAIAEDAYKTPLSLYFSKLDWLYGLSRGWLALGLTVGAAVVAARLSPAMTSETGGVRTRTLALWLSAAAVVGFTVSIRPIGALAGLLVVWFALGRLRASAVPAVMALGLVAFAVSYLTWPYLWGAPLPRLLESAAFTGAFNKPTLFDGRILMSNQLPWDYFIRIAGITLTEPFAVLAPAGILLAMRQWRRGLVPGIELSVLALWIVVPLTGLIVFKMTVYDNIRQLHFALVPLFVFGGFAIAWVADALRWRWLRPAAAGLLLIPAAVGIIRLHPYEYSYYNSFVGGVSGAAGSYTLDRWCTSYREAMGFVNANAKPGDVVAALNSPAAASPYARGDIKVSREYERPPDDADFLLTCSFFIGGYMQSTDWARVDTVRRGQAVFAEVYRRVPRP
jgi:hypothetical protein